MHTLEHRCDAAGVLAAGLLAGFFALIPAVDAPVQESIAQTNPSHDVAVKDQNFVVIGPAAINLSDSNGRFMWIIAEIGNQSMPPVVENVTVNLTIAGAVPNGCTRTPLDSAPADGFLDEALVLPGRSTFVLSPSEQAFVLYRLRYECHIPAVISTFNQTVTVSISTTPPDSPLTNNSKTVTKTIIIQ